MARYHHGNLRRALLDAAVATIEDGGVSALRLRDLARRAGVSHAAPAHHFGDRAGLLAAVATEGFERFGDALAEAAALPGSTLLDLGVAYVRFAAEHPGHFQVMFHSEPPAEDHPELAAARVRTWGQLAEAAAQVSDRLGTDPLATATAAWSAAHGLAVLAGDGALPAELGTDPAAIARRVLAALFSGPPDGSAPDQASSHI